MWDDQERTDPPDLPELQERRESLERTVPRALMDPQDPLELQVREAWWAFQESEEREA